MSLELTGTVAQVAVFVAPPDAVSVLRAVFARLPADFPAAVVVLLHSGEGRERPVVDNLNVSRRLSVSPGIEGTWLRPNHGYVIFDKQRLAIGADGRMTSAYDEGQSVGGGSEALLASLARYGSGAIAVALTKLDSSEGEGFRRVRKAGGHTIALDELDRLWTKPAGPRVVPTPEDELLRTDAIGDRMLEILLASKEASPR